MWLVWRVCRPRVSLSSSSACSPGTPAPSPESPPAQPSPDAAENTIQISIKLHPGAVLVGVGAWWGRDLAGTYLACHFGSFLKNLLFRQAKISIKNFQFRLFGGNNQIFSEQTIF